MAPGETVVRAAWRPPCMQAGRCREGVEKPEPSLRGWGPGKWRNHCGEQPGSSSDS